jgi:microsomal dipeptidase-like Zn-dependent dipeptidase
MWRQFYAKPWHEDPTAAPLVPTVEEWADHVTHAIKVAGAAHVGIGLDLTQGRSMLKDFDASNYRQLADAGRVPPLGIRPRRPSPPQFGI